MKSLLCFLFLSISAFVFSQDTLYVEGYYISQYLKTEIYDKLLSDRLKSEGKSYSTKIDYTSRDFYFAIKTFVSDDTYQFKADLFDENLIAEILLSRPRNHKNMEIFKFLPNDLDISRNKDFVTYFKSLNISIDTILFPLEKNCMKADTKFDKSYFITDESSPFVYTIYKIKGNALRIEVRNNSINDSLYERIIDYKWSIYTFMLDKRLPSFYIYFFYSADIDCNAPPEGFYKWEPNLDTSPYTDGYQELE